MIVSIFKGNIGKASCWSGASEPRTDVTFMERNVGVKVLEFDLMLS